MEETAQMNAEFPYRDLCCLNPGLWCTGQVLKSALLLPVVCLRALLGLPVPYWPQNFSLCYFLHFYFLFFFVWILEMLMLHRSINPLLVFKCFDLLVLPSSQGWLLQPLATLCHKTGRCFLKICLQNFLQLLFLYR